MEDWVLKKIAQAKAERWRFLDLGNAGLTELPPELFELEELELLNLLGTYHVFEFREWRSSENLGDENAIAIWPKDIARLTSLKVLIASSQPFENVNVEELSKLINLTSLYLSVTQVCDVAPLTKLINLAQLDLRATLVRDVAPLAKLVNLTALYLGRTQVSDIAPLANLINLIDLDLEITSISDATPLAKLINLTSLDLGYTQISDVAPLAPLVNLTSLTISETAVSDIEPLVSLINLECLFAESCHLRKFPRFLLDFEKIEELYLFANPIEDCPAEIFDEKYINCLEAARTHFADQKLGKVADRELKLILLGNGRVGKSSIAKRLIHNAFDPQEKSTHGIRLEEWTLDMAGGESWINVWDFGGQDIYHGTHALFLKSRAVFVIVWDRFTEQKPNYEADGLKFENLPLAYWLDYVRAISPQAAVIVVENKCDDGRGSLPSAELRGLPLVHFSAQEGHGRESLTAHIKEAAQRVLGQAAAHEIGTGRWAVKQTLRGYQRNDEPLPSAEKQYRRITRQQFDELCAEQRAKISSADELLKFLHNTGVLYHDSALFHGDIILDQRWAIEAIYTLFHREKCYRQLLKKHGRFTLGDLNDLAWDEAGFTLDEQRLFLSFMESCSLCFRLSKWHSDEDPNEVEYLAPELLPERETLRKEIELRTRLYDASATAIWFRFRHHFLHQGVMQRFMVRIGELFRETALYWKNGVLLEATDQRALAEVECHRKLGGNPARGEIVLHVRGVGRDLLLNQLRNELERLHDAGAEVEQQASLDGAEWIDLSKLEDALVTGKIVSDQRRALDVLPFRFLQHRDREERLIGPYKPPETSPPATPQRTPIYISYCRRDDRERVDRLFESLKADGYDVRRDEESIQYKDLISDFMAELGRGACIVTVISNEYLRSSSCMWELLTIYKKSFDLADFADRICPIVLPNTKLFEAEDRIGFIKHWRERRDQLNAQISECVEDVTGDGLFIARDRIRDIVHDVDELLTFVADMKCEPPELLEEKDFARLKAAINQRLIGPRSQ